MKQKPTPKFHVGQTVKLIKPTLYDEYEGVIEAFDELYAAPGRQGARYQLSTLSSFKFTYKQIDDQTIELYYSGELLTNLRRNFPNHPEIKTIKFREYGYDIRTSKMLSGYPEKLLRSHP